jgi:3-phosphoshikimate 1-carboxyvinyltransferase
MIEEPEEGTLCWEGGRGEAQPDATVDTYEDHRMAMALAPLSARLGCIRMNDPEVVSKSYPQFWAHLRNVGFIIEEESLC